MDYNKIALDTPDLLALLKQRGLQVSNEREALHILSAISYFRLACYFRPMEIDKCTHEFRKGATLEQALTLYKFDTLLRDMVFGAIGQIEVALRSRVNYHFSLHHTPFWFTQVDMATDGHLFTEHLSSVDRELHRSKEEFIKEHFERYDKPSFPPAWKTLEIVSFGTLSKLYQNFFDKTGKRAVAEDFGLPQHEFLISWLESLTVLRNYPQLCCIAYLLNAIDPHNAFANNIQKLMKDYPSIDATALGFPKRWEQEPLWRVEKFHPRRYCRL